MKKFVSILLALLIIGTQFSVFADAEYVPSGFKETQEKYADLISVAIEKSEYNEEQIDKEHVFIVEHTSPLQLKKGEETVWIYVALPIVESNDISYAHFDDGEYVSAVTNFAALKGTEKPYGNKIRSYMNAGYISNPSQITNVWVGEGVHVFAHKITCDGEEYIIPYYLTKDSVFNRLKSEDCNLELGKVYTLDEFLSECENAAKLFDESRKSETKQDKSTTYVKNDGDEEITESEKEDKNKGEEKPVDGGASARVYTFEELTGLSREDIDHIVIRKGTDGVGYSTAYGKIISDIYTAINTKSFDVYVKDGNSGGWQYEVIFFDENNEGYTYNISKGIYVKRNSGLTYRTSNEDELKKVVESAYNLIANDCSNWSADYIAEAKDLGFLNGLTDIAYKEPITREKFCQIIYNMLDTALDIKWQKVSPNPFKDTNDEKVLALYLAGVVNGKGEQNFAPYDYLTREEAATIIVRAVGKFAPEMPVTEMYFDYDDVNDVSDWAACSVQIISNLGFMNGVGDNAFAPQETYTAEQSVTTVVRMYEAIASLK